MKKISIILIISAIACSLFLFSNKSKVTNAFEGYIEIKTIEDLYKIRFDTTKNYVLVNDLDFNNPEHYNDTENVFYGDINNDGKIEGIFKELTTEHGWEPIGIFKGIIDGNGHVIKNLNSKYYDAAGLIGRLQGEVEYGTTVVIKRYAEVKNLGFENPNIYGLANTGTVAGIMIGAKVSNVFVNNPQIDSRGLSTGGIAGSLGNKSVVENSYVSGGEIKTFSNYTKIGGIAGEAYYGSKISNTYSTSTMKGIYNVNGILGSANGIEIYAINNISFNDYIIASAGNSNRHARTFGKEYSSFSRYDTRIDVKNISGSVLKSYDTSTVSTLDGEISGELYDKNFLNETGLFQGIWMTYSNFVDESFYSSNNKYIVEFDEKEYDAGFKEGCLYVGLQACGNMLEGTAELDFYTVDYWDFEETWEILEGAGRPTLKVFNKEDGPKDDGHLSTAPTKPSNLQVAGTEYKNNDQIRLSWERSYLVKRQGADGLSYDIYIVDGLNDNCLDTEPINKFSLVEGKDVITVNGISSYVFTLGDGTDYNSNNLRFCLIAHNGGSSPERTAPIYSTNIAIDNKAPELFIKKINGEIVTQSNKTVNTAFTLGVNDATSVLIDVKHNGQKITEYIPRINTVYSENGTYSFEVLDKMGFSSTFEVTLNNIKPNIVVLDSSKESILSSYISSKDITISVDGENLDLKYSLNGSEKMEWKSGATFKADGVYEFYATNQDGNTAFYKVIIDKEAPKVTRNDSSDKYTLNFSELIVSISYDGKNWIDLNENTMDIEKDANISKVYLKDHAGRVVTVDLEDGNNNTFEFVMVIASSLITVALIGVIVYIVIQRKRGI